MCEGYVIRGTLLAARQTECGVIVLLFIAPSLYEIKMMRVYKVRLYDKVTAVTHSRWVIDTIMTGSMSLKPRLVLGMNLKPEIKRVRRTSFIL
jgi:hypothetical protein